MKKFIFIIILLLNQSLFSQTLTEILIPTGLAAISFVAADADIKELAKEISQFRSKEFIINYIIGSATDIGIKFETESLASDNSGGLVSVAFNCNEVNVNGLLLAFLGNNRDADGRVGLAYAFKYIPFQEAQDLLKRIDFVKTTHTMYLSDELDVNNVYIESGDIKFILYGKNGDTIRVFWNGFEVIWERMAFDRTKRRLDRWFKQK